MLLLLLGQVESFCLIKVGELGFGFSLVIGLYYAFI